MALALLPAASMRESSVRVLRWSYRRDDEIVVCELGLDRRDSVYELSTAVPWAEKPATEIFVDAIAALHRQAAMERLLLDEGWHLEAFDSLTVERARSG